MASGASLLCFLSLFSLFLFASPTTITIPLYTSIKHPSSDPLQILNDLASLSISRARDHKSPKSNFSAVDIPLYSRSYGGYSIPLSFGTPPQNVRFVMDTGSSLVWFPCTPRYTCSGCNFLNVDPTKIPTFIPRRSSSAKLIGCKNPKCQWIFGPDVQSACRDCDSNVQNCTKTCPPYAVQYGLGSTTGLLLSETLDFSNQTTVPDFLVGCSILSNRQPEGIAGFGRSRESIPSQLGAKKFSYCLQSRRYDETSASSDLVLYTSSDSGHAKTKGVAYTRFMKNPNVSNTALQSHYYVLLRRIIVGSKHVRVPYSFLVPGADGDGGTIVDSGTTFTFMERPIFEPVAQEFEKQMANYTLATDVQNRTGLRPCFNISGHEFASVPELIFAFKGGAKMELPLTNYFAIAGDGVVCLTIVTNNLAGPGAVSGPAIILGNFQQQNFYIEYDVQNNRFGFKQQRCA
uniref:Pepsin A n=1 Tax=Rhizophora mucronata TaxID=61149 RepID=A0A2P2Q5H4_RHIMU